MNRRKSITFEIALAGISTALALIMTVLYYYSPLGKISFLALSAVALMLPLCVGHVRGAALAYVATGGLCIAIIGPIPALPFIFLFGWQPVVMGVGERYLKGKLYFSLPLKAILCNAGLYGTYTLYGLGDSINHALQRLSWAPQYWVIAILATILFLAYDYAMQWVFKWLNRRLAKITAKYKPIKPKDEKEDNDTNSTDTSTHNQDIFGEHKEADEDEAPVDQEKGTHTDDKTEHTHDEEAI